MSAEDSSSYLISTLKGFGKAADEAESIVDIYNEVANNWAIDTAGIGEALQRSAASFYAANTDLEKSVALITATNTVVQDPSSVGTLWKTLSARIRGAKTELQELDEETDEYTETTSKLRDLVKGLTGFDILKEDGETFKDIYEIILGIGQEWENLTDVEQASLAEALAGKRNSNALLAVLNNLDTLEGAYKSALEAEGSAQKEQENYARSIQYSIDVLKASAQEFWTTLINSGAAKSLIDFLTKLLNVLTKITEATDGLPIFAGAGLLALLGGSKQQETITALSNGIQKFFGFFKEGTEVVEDTINVLDGGATAFEAIQNGADVAANGMATLGTKTIATKSAFATLMANPITPWIIGIGLALGVAALAWDHFTVTVNEAKQEVDKVTSKIENLKSEITKLEEIDYRTDEQNARLDGLKAELDLQERILKVEQKRLMQAKYGTSFADSFDSDNYNTILSRATDNHFQNKNSISSRLDTITKAQESIAETESKIDRLQEKVLKGTATATEKAQLKTFQKTLDSQKEALDKHYIDLEKIQLEYQGYIDDIQADIASGNLSAEQLRQAQETQEGFETLVRQMSDVVNVYKKQQGTFDYSSAIESVFQHAEFDGVKDKLVELAKDGSLSVDYLTEHFNGLISVLLEAGVDAEDLYKYLLKISGIVDTKNLSERIAKNLGKKKYDSKGYEINQAFQIEEYLNSLSEDDRKIVAGLDIDWSTFNADEAIKKMQSEINKSHESPLEVDVEFDTAKFNQQEDELEKLQSLYESFRGNVENNVLKVPLDISDVESLRETWAEKVGKDTFDKFEFKVTTSTDISEVQKAFDDMATAYGRSMLEIQGLTAETMDMVKAQLKLDGLEDTGVEKLVDSLAAEEKMNDFVSALERGQDAEHNMSDSAISAALSIYEEGKQLGLTDEMLKDYLMQALKAGNVVLGGDTSWLDLLAEKLDIDISKLKELLSLTYQGSGYAINSKNKVQSTYMPSQVGNVKDWSAQQQKWRNEQKYQNNSFVPTTKDARAAGGGAGKEAADAYIEAFEKEKSALERDRDMGLISEKEYLDKLKALIDKFFKDRTEYAERYMDEMKSYMDALLTHYNSVISGVTTLLDRKISAANKGKDAAIKALQEEQKAAEEAYQAQIDGIQAEIDAIDDLIDAKNDEIDKLNDQIQAIQDANDERDRSIQLQKAEYELQRAMHQRTKLVNIYARDYSNVA